MLELKSRNQKSNIDKAKFMGTIPLDWIKLPNGIGKWEPYQTEDIFATNFINYPHDYLFTLASGINISYSNLFSSLATTPNYELSPKDTRYYIAGRDIVRWGGEKDPDEIDFDRYVFTPNIELNIANVYKAPKSEPHHFSDIPNYIDIVPKNLRELCFAIRNGDFIS